MRDQFPSFILEVIRNRKTEPSQLERTLAPTWEHFDPEIEIHPGPQEAFDLGSGRRAQITDRYASTPDDDPLLRCTLHQYHRPNVYGVRVLAILFNTHCNAVGYLLLVPLED